MAQNEAKEEVNSPLHYTKGGIETIDFIQAKLTPEEFRGYCKGNALKYLSRATYKGKESTDYQKAEWYIKRLNDVSKQVPEAGKQPSADKKFPYDEVGATRFHNHVPIGSEPVRGWRNQGGGRCYYPWQHSPDCVCAGFP